MRRLEPGLLPQGQGIRLLCYADRSECCTAMRPQAPHASFGHPKKIRWSPLRRITTAAPASCPPRAPGLTSAAPPSAGFVAVQAVVAGLESRATAATSRSPTPVCTAMRRGVPGASCAPSTTTSSRGTPTTRPRSARATPTRTAPSGAAWRPLWPVNPTPHAKPSAARPVPGKAAPCVRPFLKTGSTMGR